MSFSAQTLALAGVARATDDAVVLTFDDSAAPFVYAPGQFLTLELEANGKKERRAYSLCSTYGVDAMPAVCVKQVIGGLLSPKIVSGARVGEAMRVFTPLGSFTFTPTQGARRHIVLIGAGSGITPLFSILKSVLKQEPGSYVSLIYGNRKKDSIIFRSELDELAADHPRHLRVVHALTQAPAGWAGPQGRITGQMVTDLLPHLSPLEDVAETRYYLCGPQAMAESVEMALLADGVKKSAIYKESFFSDNLLALEAKTAVPASQPEAGDISKVKIILDGKEYQVDVPPGVPILDAALDMDIDLPYSCKAGLCTACRGKCLSGKVQMDETEGLADSEIAQGYVLLCVGHPAAAGTVVEVG